MAQPSVFLICDESDKTQRAKSILEGMGFKCENYSFTQWKENIRQPDFFQTLNLGTPQLFAGMSVESQSLNGANVIQFPPNGGIALGSNGSKVSTIEEMESKAIEGAIFQFRGNLTEAAKALGIGRATLYRKVKQYQIDPSAARKRRAA